MLLCFFFSSRRRHTRYWRDWSSDVCSSDLSTPRQDPPPQRRQTGHPLRARDGGDGRGVRRAPPQGGPDPRGRTLMLRSEHVMARLSRGKLIPRRLASDDPRALEVAGELCELYAACLGGPRARLEEGLAARGEELGPQLATRRGFRVVRALSNLLEERAEWVSPPPADPYT